MLAFFSLRAANAMHRAQVPVGIIAFYAEEHDATSKSGASVPSLSSQRSSFLQPFCRFLAVCSALASCLSALLSGDQDWHRRGPRHPTSIGTFSSYGPYPSSHLISHRLIRFWLTTTMSPHPFQPYSTSSPDSRPHRSRESVRLLSASSGRATKWFATARCHLCQR